MLIRLPYLNLQFFVVWISNKEMIVFVPRWFRRARLDGALLRFNATIAQLQTNERIARLARCLTRLRTHSQKENQNLITSHSILHYQISPEFNYNNLHY